MQKKEIYQAPAMKIVEVKVENGFQTSGNIQEQTTFTTNWLSNENGGGSTQWLENDWATGESLNEVNL